METQSIFTKSGLTVLVASLIIIVFNPIGNDVKSESNGGKITVCHAPPGNPENRVSIEISINSLDAHLAHGDFIGCCNNGCDDLNTTEAGSVYDRK